MFLVSLCQTNLFEEGEGGPSEFCSDYIVGVQRRACSAPCRECEVSLQLTGDGCGVLVAGVEDHDVPGCQTI
jgi:hypothetical protein